MANPYEQADIIGSAARGANLVLGLQDVSQSRKDRAQARQFQAEDRQRMRELQGREDAAYRRGLELQAPVEEEKELLGAERAGRLALARDLPKQVAFQERQRIYTENGWLTPEQQKAINKWNTDAAEIGVEADRETLASARDKRKRASDKEAAILRIVESYNTARHKAASLQRPEVAEPIMDLYSAISSRDGAKLSEIGPKALPAFDELLKDQFERVVGTKVHGTDDTIIGGTLADVMIDRGKPGIADDDTAVLVYNIVAQSPDGKQRTYQAPIDESRNSDPDARVMRFPLSQLEQIVGDAAETGLDVQQGNLTPEAIQLEAAQALALSGVDPKTIDVLLGRGGLLAGEKSTALIQNAEYLVQKAGFESPRAAVEFLSWAKYSPQEAALELTAGMVEQQRKYDMRPGDPGYRTPKEMAEDAKAIVRAVLSDDGPAQPGAATGGAAKPGGQFEEGKTYVDANGNRATYRNGQFVPVQ